MDKYSQCSRAPTTTLSPPKKELQKDFLENNPNITKSATFSGSGNMGSKISTMFVPFSHHSRFKTPHAGTKQGASREGDGFAWLTSILHGLHEGSEGKKRGQ